MPIWFNKNIALEDLADIRSNTMAEFLGLKFTEIGDDYLKMTMPVNATTKQPYGFLHGGASCVLAETVGSVGSALIIDQSKFICVGLEINANHLKSVSQGIVTAVARPLHLGRTTHVWDIKIFNQEEKLFCVSRLTVAIVPKKKTAE
jgi:1,4-dihydroxy-2-naphthoyl-CoA hydrolase